MAFWDAQCGAEGVFGVQFRSLLDRQVPSNTLSAPSPKARVWVL